MRPLYGGRELTTCACHYTLVTSYRMLTQELKRLELYDETNVHHRQSDACTFLIGRNETKLNKDIAIVYLKKAGPSTIQTATLLVHEAVHIWQWHTRLIGSFNDHGDEEEAYAIQTIAQNLMFEYVRQTGKGCK